MALAVALLLLVSAVASTASDVARGRGGLRGRPRGLDLPCQQLYESGVNILDRCLGLDWAGGGCPVYAVTAGGSCDQFCQERGQRCAAAADNAGSASPPTRTCEVNASSQSEGATPKTESFCGVARIDQICVCQAPPPAAAPTAAPTSAPTAAPTPAPSMQRRPYVGGPFMVSNSRHSSCTGGYDLQGAEEACDLTPGCEVLHDWGCDGKNWRVCSEVTSTFWAAASDSSACTRVVEGYTPPPLPSAPVVTSVFVCERTYSFSRHATVVQGIRFTYENDEQRSWGPTSACTSPRTWNVPQGEYIVSMLTRAGCVSDRVRFVTNAGNQSPDFGTSRGGSPVNFHANPGSHIFELVRNNRECPGNDHRFDAIVERSLPAPTTTATATATAITATTATTATISSIPTSTATVTATTTTTTTVAITATAATAVNIGSTEAASTTAAMTIDITSEPPN